MFNVGLEVLVDRFAEASQIEPEKIEPILTEALIKNRAEIKPSKELTPADDPYNVSYLIAKSVADHLNIRHNDAAILVTESLLDRGDGIGLIHFTETAPRDRNDLSQTRSPHFS